MYRIRFHGRGGQGMKTASRILGSAFFIQGYEVQDAPRYGAERRGAPIFAFVRADKSPINERGIITNPDLIIVADDTLVPVPAAGVLAGADAHSLLLINSHTTMDEWRQRLNYPGPMVVLPASEEVVDRAEMPFIGTVCAAAAAALCTTITRESLQQAIEQELGHLGREAVDKNLQRALESFDLIKGAGIEVEEGKSADASRWIAPEWIELPFDAARISAPVIHAADNTDALKTGAWRTMRPVIDYARCNKCWWVCSTFCPDGAIAVEEGTPVIDYDHCKGCLVCVAQCPPHAIEAVPEQLAAAGENKP
jgi:pyruvate ferredoxin oxidoreductase gamma subunit